MRLPSGHRQESARGECNKTREKLPSRLKSVKSTQFTSALKHRPPKEKDFSRSLKSVCTICRRRSGLSPRRQLRFLFRLQSGCTYFFANYLRFFLPLALSSTAA